MSYRDDLEAIKARHAALDAEVTERTRERDEAERLLSEALHRKSLPVLPNIHIAAPCPAEWGNMVGDERVRHCGECDKNVYNLSDMTRAEAEALIVANEGKLCVRYYQRKDGTVLTKDCPVGVQRRRRRRFFAASAALILGAAAVADRFRAPSPDATPCFTNVPASVDYVTPERPAFPPEPPTSPEVKLPPHIKAPPKLMGKIAPPRREIRGDIAGGISVPDVELKF